MGFACLLQITDDLAVQIVEGGGEKKQRADDPAVASGLALVGHVLSRQEVIAF